MAIDPCLTPTDSVLLEALGNPRSLKASLNISKGNGNPLQALGADSGQPGVEALDPWASDTGGVGVNDAVSFQVVPQVPPVLGVWIVVTAGTGRSPAIRMPSAMGDVDRKASLLWPLDPSVPWAKQLPVADATNPRVDRIVATWNNAGGLDIVVKPGTPTSGATLDNLLGASAVDETVEVRLGDVLVDAGAVTIASNKIRDRRPFAPDAGIPVAAGTGTAAVAPLHPLAAGHFPAQLVATIFNNQQAAALVRLDRDIVANFLYWSYSQQGAGSLTGTWTVALLDISRRSVGGVGFGNFISPGDGGIVRFRSALTTPGRILRAGLYYVFFGVSAITLSGSTDFVYDAQTAARILVPNTYYHRGSGSTTVPTGDIVSAGHTDAFSDVFSANAAVLPVPRVAVGAA